MSVADPVAPTKCKITCHGSITESPSDWELGVRY